MTYREKLIEDYGEGKAERIIESNSCVCDYYAVDNEINPQACYRTFCVDCWDASEEDLVNHPLYYGGDDNPYETIKVINAWDLDFELGNAIKYISRAGKKDPSKKVKDLKKAIWYINHTIERIESDAKN